MVENFYLGTAPDESLLYYSRERPNLTCKGHLEMTFRERPKLTFKGRPWEFDLGRPQDVSGCPLEDLQSTQTWMSQHFF